MGGGVVEPFSGPPSAARVLLVENDAELSALLVRLLSGDSYEVDVAAEGRRGLRLGLTNAYDVVVLARGLPDIDGLDLLVSLRLNGMLTPTLVLSELGDPADRVAVLDSGADDYLARPFDDGELLARLRALCRRHVDTDRCLRVPGGALDVDLRQVTVPDGPVALSARETALLATLARRPNRVFSRDELRVLAFDGAGVQIVDTYVHYLRRKLGRTVITTVRGHGYQLGPLR
ncbi:MAG TPA: response regulator transcription factor [Pseudonocardiaceae bacterium]|nr:response regulator transcription factor [Pseudonocardiaceae bacterium]